MRKIILLTLFKNITVRRTNTLFRSFLMGRSGFTTKGGTSRGLSLQTQKFELPPSAGYHRHQKNWITLPFPSSHIGEKVFLIIAFRLILPKLLPVAHIFSHRIMTYWLEQNSLIQNSVQLNYLPELYPLVFPLLTKKDQKWPLLWYCFVVSTKCGI